MKAMTSSMILSSLLFATVAEAETTQADINLDFGRFAGFWVYEGCEKKDISGKCWFIIEKKKELYGNKEYFSFAMQKAIPAKAEVLEKICGDFKYTTGFTVTNLPDKAICIKVIGAGDQAELYYPIGYTGHGTYKISKSSKEEFMRRNDEKSKKMLKDGNF
ncbi:hypothetical protein L6218_25535 [Pseudomonas syringae pv. syringae]|nr:hypothetical protein [Pseudomonas syringae]AVB23806.1 hypothetical protein BKC06_001040 [Pseudomonas syringae pv. syringae]KWS13185.1 hypothetical protein AL063_13740 [Pseudomonas syringae pv. syringae]MCF5182948.1 hypothetical protein [Pseudomonas syringae]MCF5316398.1 hypothetical protein [Pseudomonas syringae]MCF5365289.1 hypothetical protein [Pseudomonas syringae]